MVIGNLLFLVDLKSKKAWQLTFNSSTWEATDETVAIFLGQRVFPWSRVFDWDSSFLVVWILLLEIGTPPLKPYTSRVDTVIPMAATETQIKSIHVMTSLIIQVIVKIYTQKGKKVFQQNGDKIRMGKKFLVLSAVFISLYTVLNKNHNIFT